jgi:hypothetical protein
MNGELRKGFANLNFSKYQHELEKLVVLKYLRKE